MPDSSSNGANRSTDAEHSTDAERSTGGARFVSDRTAKPMRVLLTSGSVILDRHELIDQIDEFGPTQWWRATDTELARPVLVSITTNATDNDAGRPRAVAQQRLRFTPIIHDVQDTDTGLVVVMEPVSGISLRQLLRERGRMNLDAAADELWLPLAAAMQEAHDVGLFHGNLRPELVWVDSGPLDQPPTLLGFEAPWIDPEAVYTGPELRDESTNDSTAGHNDGQTTAGTGPTAAGDVYALSAMLYEMISGHRPAATPDRLHHQSDLEWPIADVVMGGLDANPSERPHSPGALVAAIGGARPQSAPKRVRKAIDTPQLQSARPGWLFPVLALFSLAIIGAVIGWTSGVFSDDSEVTNTATSAGISEADAARLAEATVEADSASEPTATVEPTPEPAPTATATPPPTPTPAPIAITQAIPFDPPPGSTAENNAAGPFVFDGVEGTEWSTEVYGSSNFGGLKQGVGIWVEFAPATVRSITLRSTAPGWRAQIHLADNPAETLTGWGEPVATISLTERNTGQVTARFSAQEAQAALIWFTELTSFGGGFGATLDDITFNNDPMSAPQRDDETGEPGEAVEPPTP